MTTVAIMQPYLFPYLGYYQLAAKADVFVFLDDVNFRKGSFINRNYVIDPSGTAIRFTLPVRQQSPNRAINDHVYADPGKKPIKTFRQCYGDDAANSEYGAIFERVVTESPGTNVAELNAKSIRWITEALGVDTEFLVSSKIDPNPTQKGESRVLSLCTRLGASRYINLPGGRSLYDAAMFSAQGIDLRFLRQPMAETYCTSEHTRTHPSFLHHLMTEPRDRTQEMLGKTRISNA